MAEGEIARGGWLCFTGRASGTDQCGSVNAVERYTCCDATERAFVFSRTNAVARSGDSGGPVYQPIGDDQARAVGILSSSGRHRRAVVHVLHHDRRPPTGLGGAFVNG